MSTHTLATSLEPIFLEEGNSETAVTARFVKVAGVFAQFPHSTINDASELIKSDEVRRLAMGGWLLYTYGATKDNKTAVYKMARLGKSEVYRSVMKADTFDKVVESYKKAVKRLTKVSQAKRQEANTSGVGGKALLKSASRLDDESIIFTPDEEQDDYIKALKAVIKRYESAKTSVKVKAVMSAPEPALIS